MGRRAIQGGRKGTGKSGRAQGVREGRRALRWGWGRLGRDKGLGARQESPTDGEGAASGREPTCQVQQVPRERPEVPAPDSGQGLWLWEDRNPTPAVAGPSHPPGRRKKLQLSLERGGAGLLKGPHSAPGS